jgi:uncharacterized membrane protein
MGPIVLIAVLLVVIVLSFVFVFKGDVDFQNTLDERAGRPPSRSLGGTVVFFLIAGVAGYLLFNH